MPKNERPDYDLHAFTMADFLMFQILWTQKSSAVAKRWIIVNSQGDAMVAKYCESRQKTIARWNAGRPHDRIRNVYRITRKVYDQQGSLMILEQWEKTRHVRG